MKRLALVFLMAVVFLCAVPVDVGARKDDDLSEAVKAVEALAAAEFGATGLGSLTVGVVHGRKLIWTRSWGYADIDKKELATKDTVYRIGGLSTKFTTLMLLQLVEAGKVRLDDPVEKYFPEINLITGRDPSSPPVTFYQLATNTSGLPPEPSNYDLYTRGPVATWEQTLIAALPHTRYAAKPGAKLIYSNIAYAILGAALARVAGEPYVSYMEKHIFAPLGMKHTAFEPNAVIKPLLAKGYVVTGTKVDGSAPEREHQGRGYKVPSGAIYSTVSDLARYTSFELGHGPATVLKRQTLEQNYQNIVKVNQPEQEMIGYGLGFQVRPCGDVTVYGHGGFVSGYHARGDFNLAADVGLVLLRNIDGGNLHNLTRKLACDSLVQLVTNRHPSNHAIMAPAKESEPVTQWFTTNAVPLKSVAATENFADLKPLKQVFRGVRIVGLGEETHGTREFFQLKRRLIEYLVKEAGFTVFAMELSYAASLDINEYVLNGKGDRDRLLARQGQWAWDTQEVAELIEWLRQYNTTVPPERKVRFFGFDIHNTNQAVELVSKYLAKVAPERLEAFTTATQRFGSDETGRQHLEYTIQVSTADKDQTLATLNELLGFLYLNQTRLTLQTSAAEFAQALENATVLAEFADTFRRSPNLTSAARDLYLAQNLIRRINAEKPGTRFIVWAHNDHIGKYKNVLGSYLQTAYGPDYYALGFTFNQGAFQARELASNVTIGALKEFKVDAAPEDSVEWSLNRTGLKNFIIDFRNTAKTEAIEQWLTTPRRMRSIGLGFISDTKSFQRVNLQQTFDGLAFIETSTRAHPNPTGLRDAWIIPDKAKTN